MRSPSLPLRTAYANKLNTGIIYEGKQIFAFEEFLQETTTRKKAIIQIGTMNIEAYIILLNQTENRNGQKCHHSDECSIQVQINTVYPSNKGGSKVAEEIADLVYQKLFPTNDLKADIVLPAPFNCWKSSKESARNIPYSTDSANVWVHQILFANYISQS